MKAIRWSLSKNEALKKERGVSFDDIIRSKLVAIKKHPKKKHQKIMLFKCQGYIWVVPFVESKDEIFLKTLFPSRKYTKLYHKGK